MEECMPVNRSHICIATLGAQPQVVSLALDALYAAGYPIRELFAIHLATRNERMGLAIQRLDAEFINGRYQGHPCRYQRRPVQLGREQIEDLHGEDEAAAASKMLHQLISELKQEEATLHLCVSGGRRLLGMLALSAALLYFDQTDKIWHLYSSDEVRAASAAGAQMHLPANKDVRLIAVDLPTWGQFFPALRTAANKPGPSARATVERTVAAANRTLLQALLQQLTPRQREVLRYLVANLTVAEVAQQLGIASSTVHSHRDTILHTCREIWADTENGSITLSWLRRTLGPLQDEL
jgi:CRISPR-associated protein Csx14